jgi:arsenate reductase
MMDDWLMMISQIDKLISKASPPNRLNPMTKAYHLSTCNTCQRILKEWNLGPEAVIQEIKTEPITPDQLDEMKKLAGSYEALFSRRAMKYRALGLHEQTLTEEDYRNYILQEYTFLKRPVLIVADQIFVGNAKKVVAAAKQALGD